MMYDTLKCNTCNAPKHIKESLGCNGDRLFNAREVFKSEFLKGFKIKYEPQFQCRFADLIECIEEDKLMEQEKQIEEIDRVLRSVFGCQFAFKFDIEKYGGYGGHKEVLTKSIAKKLYSGGCRKLPDNMGDFSDGYHTFNELYHHRAVLFSVICNMMPERAWKSKLHDTGDMYDGMFIVGIETEQGQATYHYDIEPYWDMFKVKVVERAPKWDGHTAADAIQRIGNISCNGHHHK